MIPHQIEVGHEYSIIDVDGEPDTIQNAITWCKDSYGEPGPRWFYTFKRFYFKNSKDALWFELRW